MLSVNQLSFPKPILRLNWGENIPKDIFQKLKEGEVAILYGEDNNPYSEVLMDYFGTIRERRIKRDNGKGEAERAIQC